MSSFRPLQHGVLAAGGKARVRLGPRLTRHMRNAAVRQPARQRQAVLRPGAMQRSLSAQVNGAGDGVARRGSDDEPGRGVDPAKGVAAPYRWLLTALGYYGKESTDIRIGQALCRSCEEQSELVSKDESFGLDFEWFDNKNFQVRQQLMMLHVWMIHRRLLADDQRGKDVQEILFDTLWEDTTRRIRATGVHELTVNKHLSQVQKTCFTSAVSYDHGLNITTDENLELGSAIWRNVYQSDPKTPDECVYRMADYVRNQIAALHEMDASELYDGKISWIDLEVASSKLAGEWRQAVASNGRTYWWNVKTRESRWTSPPSP